MNMVGIGIFFGNNRGRALLQAFDRQAIRRINSRHPQYRQTGFRSLGPSTQDLFRIDPPLRPCILRIHRPRFIKLRFTAVSINAGSAHINESGVLG